MRPAPPSAVQFPTRRSRLADLRPGERLLLLRKYGGLGDILIASQLFPMLADQYPEIRVTFACPRPFHALFRGSGLDLLAYEDVWGGADHQPHRANVKREILERYDLIEDISIPCHIWENFFVAFGGIDPGSRLRWRNRLDMWGRWFGLQIRDPRTNIVITEAERSDARALLTATVGSGRPVCLLAPFSANATKSYPWVDELAAAIRTDGYAVALLHQGPIPTGLPLLASLPLRMMGAACAVADLIVSVDSAAFHWGGILRRPTVGIFNVNDGAAYCRYYPTAHPVQTCATPCINVRYGPRQGTYRKHVAGVLPRPGWPDLSRCYPRSSVDQIMEAVHELS